MGKGNSRARGAAGVRGGDGGQAEDAQGDKGRAGVRGGEGGVVGAGQGDGERAGEGGGARW